MKPPSSSRVSKWLQSLESCINKYSDKVFTNELLSELFVDVCAVVQPSMKNNTNAMQTMKNCLSHLIVKVPITKKVLKRNLTRICANWHFIQEGMNIPDWDGSKLEADVVFIGLKKIANGPVGHSMYLVMFKLKTGLMAGIILCAEITDGAIALFLTQHSGTFKLNCAVEELAGMQARVVVSMKYNGTVCIHAWDCTAAHKKHNQELTRHRIDPEKCPNPIPCNVCDKDIKQCPLAVWLPTPKEK